MLFRSHHILFTRIPNYRRSDLAAAQSTDKSLFEYWTHALAYVPVRDLRFYIDEMKQHRSAPMRWYADADPNDLKKLLRQIRKDGAISIRDIDTDELWKRTTPGAAASPASACCNTGSFRAR